MTASINSQDTVDLPKPSALYRRVWRWHFFAGLLVAPISVLLAITGAIYVFAPYIDNFADDVINSRSAVVSGHVLSADDQVAKALQQYPNARFTQYIMPRENDSSAQLDVRLANGEKRRLWINIFSGQVLNDAAVDKQTTEIVKGLHAELLNGDIGSLFVELAASWMIILIISGCYLYWPRDRTWRQVFLPKMRSLRGRQKVHAVHGAVASWSAVFVLVFLMSGLPWTQVWGGAFDWAQKTVGIEPETQVWNVTLKSQPRPQATTPRVSLQSVINGLENERLTPPITIKAPRPDGVWTVRNMPSNRADRLTLHFDQWTGAELMRIDFASQHWLQRLTSNGVSLHVGHLFGVFNHVLAVLLAMCVIAIAVTGPLMWWRRRPTGALAPPPLPKDTCLAGGAIVLILSLAIFLPLAGGSIVIVAIVDQIISRSPD